MKTEKSNFAAIFDLDGVIIDSVGINWQSYIEVLKTYDIEFPKSEIGNYVGRTLKNQVDMINDNFGSNIDLVEFEVSVKRIRDELNKNLKPKKGVVQLLKELKTKNVSTAIATSNSSEQMDIKLGISGVRDFFDYFISQDDVSKHKPDPEVFLKAAEKLGYEPSKCIVFEDAPAGVAAAVNGGMKCCAVTTEFVQPDKLNDADILVNELDEVNLEEIERLFD